MTRRCLQKYFLFRLRLTHFPQCRIRQWLKQRPAPSTLWCNRCSRLVHMGSKLSLSPCHLGRRFPARWDGWKERQWSCLGHVEHHDRSSSLWVFDFSLFLGFCLSRRSTQIKTYSWDNAQVVLAGNKCDMEEERVVSVDSGRLLAEQLGKSSHDPSAEGGLRLTFKAAQSQKNPNKTFIKKQQLNKSIQPLICMEKQNKCWATIYIEQGSCSKSGQSSCPDTMSYIGGHTLKS